MGGKLNNAFILTVSEAERYAAEDKKEHKEMVILLPLYRYVFACPPLPPVAALYVLETEC